MLEFVKQVMIVVQKWLDLISNGGRLDVQNIVEQSLSFNEGNSILRIAKPGLSRLLYFHLSIILLADNRIFFTWLDLNGFNLLFIWLSLINLFHLGTFGKIFFGLLNLIAFWLWFNLYVRLIYLILGFGFLFFSDWSFSCYKHFSDFPVNSRSIHGALELSGCPFSVIGFCEFLLTFSFVLQVLLICFFGIGLIFLFDLIIRLFFVILCRVFSWSFWQIGFRLELIKEVLDLKGQFVVFGCGRVVLETVL